MSSDLPSTLPSTVPGTVQSPDLTHSAGSTAAPGQAAPTGSTSSPGSGDARPVLSRRRALAAFVVAAAVFAVGFLVISNVAGAIEHAAGGGKVPPPVVYILLAADALLAAYVSTRWVERRPLSVWGIPRHPWRSLASGFGAGAVLNTAIVAAMLAAGWYSATYTGGSKPTWFLSVIVLYLGIAVFEEVLFRAVATRLLQQVIGTWAALALSAVLFGLAHAANPNASLIGVLATAAAGTVVSALYIATRDLFLVIGLHWAWNLFEGGVWGVPVSGNDFGRTLFTGTVNGPAAWTGGAFGPEAGIIAGALAVVVTVLLVRLIARRGYVVPLRRRA